MSVSVSDTEFLFNAAVRFHQQGNLQRASELYDRVQTINPQHAMSLNNQALIARALGRLDLSLSMLENALRVEPRNFEILANLGRVSLQKGDTSAAISHLREALRMRPQDDNLKLCLGKALYARHLYGEAKTVFLKMIENESLAAEPYYYLGLIAVDEGSDSRALRCFQRALRVEPEHSGALDQLDRHVKGFLSSQSNLAAARSF